MAYITTTSERDYNAQWENVGIPDDFNGSKPHHDRELFRLLQRPCGLLTALKKLRIASYLCSYSCSSEPVLEPSANE